jgi:hypothetical protein
MDFVATQPYAKEFEKIGLLLDRLGDVKVDREVEAGLLTSDYYTARGEFVAGEGTLRKAAYRNYRNLGGVNNDLDEDYTNDPSLVIGRKFNMRGKDKAALGRADEAPDILARTLLAAEASIIRSNKNKVAQRILAFFETNYDPNFVSINEQSFKRQIDNNGFVNLVENTSYYNQPDVFVAKVRGIPVTIRFKDAGYNSITEAIHGKSDPQSDHPVRHVFQVLGRFTGSLITKYNPYWIPVNFVRDVQTLFFNASANGQIGVGMAGKMMKALLPAMGTAIRIALMDMHVTTTAGKMAKASMLKLMDSKAGSTVAVAAGAAGIAAILPGIGIAAGAGVGALIGMFASNSKASQQRMAMYEEGRKAGAFTSFINHKDLESQVIAINEAIHGKSAISQIHGMLKFWELVTIPVEMAPRLAAYAVMRSEGASQIDAADYAGGVTVDFNMRGADEWLRAAYLFFNPAVQGTAQLLKLMKDNPRRVATVAGGLWMIGFMTSALVRMKGGDDEDEKEKRRRERGLSVLDEIPDYKRATSLIIAPGKHGGAIPIAYGWNAPFALGVFMADSVVGNVPWSVTAKRSMTATFEAFSPVGGNGFDMTKIFSDPAGQAVALIAPTALAPVAQWMTNTNRFGGPLYPSGQFGSGGGSDTKKAFQSVNPISQWMADTLQEATGGDRRNKLGIDLNPALIDHVSQAYFPGLISEMYKGAGMLVRKEKGLDTPKDKEPFWDRFSANPAESFDAAAFRRIDNAISDISKELKDTPRTSPRFQQIIAAHPQFGNAELALKITNRDLDKLRSELNAAESTAYMYRKEGKIEEANKMDKSNVEFRNQTRKAEQILFERMVTAASKSGFKAEIYSD